MKLPALVVVLAAGCSPHAHGPAWPKPHDRLADGGESLAPHASNPIAATATASGDDAAIADIPLAPTAITPAATPAAPTAAPPAKPPDEPVMTEELIIEIDD